MGKVSVLHVKSAQNNLRSKPKRLAGGSKDSVDMRQHRYLNKSALKFGRFSTNC